MKLDVRKWWVKVLMFLSIGGGVLIALDLWEETPNNVARFLASTIVVLALIRTWIDELVDLFVGESYVNDSE